MRRSSFLWLTGIAIAFGALVTMVLALAMIAKGGSHIDYCPNLPAGHILPCMPSGEGVRLAALMTLAFALPVFGVGALIGMARWLLGRLKPRSN